MWIFAIVMTAREINHKPWLRDKEHWVLFPCTLVTTNCLYFKSKKKKKKWHPYCLLGQVHWCPTQYLWWFLGHGGRDYPSSPSVSDCPFKLLLSTCNCCPFPWLLSFHAGHHSFSFTFPLYNPMTITPGNPLLMFPSTQRA